MVVEAVGRYRLLKKLASGNMGEIFLAEQGGEAGFRKQLVIKRLFPHLAVHPEAVRMFQDEAHVLSALSHPNIPQVYDLGVSDGQWFIAIEYVPGHTLFELCAAGARAGVPMPLDATISAVEQLCDALHHAHERCEPDGRPLRIVHRDVTPHNLMVTPDGFAKLLDFGVARTAREDTTGGGVKGTLAYMSPEQVRGQRLDKRSDVFSIGVVLYELTTGRRLFYGSEVEVMTAIVERDVMPPTSWVPGYPAELERIVLMALARDRARRWPSASHLARAIEDYCASLGLVATHQSLARYYQQVFSSEEKAARGSGSYRPAQPVVAGAAPPRPTASIAVPPPPAAASAAPPHTVPSPGTNPPRPAPGLGSSPPRPAAGLGTNPPRPAPGLGTSPPRPAPGLATSPPRPAPGLGTEPPRPAPGLGTEPPRPAPGLGTNPPRPGTGHGTAPPGTGHGTAPPRPSEGAGSRPPRPGIALDDLRTLRTPPPPADRLLLETPRAIRLPSPDETPDEPLVLTRPKRGA